MRVDGAYFEFNSAVAYHTPYRFPRQDPVGVDENTPLPEKAYDVKDIMNQMFISFYLKPNFYPECSERERQFVTSNLYGYAPRTGSLIGEGLFLSGLYWLPAY